jgi:hypothetical protein
MPAHPDPSFLSIWVRAELSARGEAHDLDALAARAEADGLDPDDAELDAARELAGRRGLLAALDEAAADLGEVQVREARSGFEWVERPLRPEGQHDLFGELSPASCTAFLRAEAGAAARLAQLARQLAEAPDATRAELPLLGGTPGCSLR